MRVKQALIWAVVFYYAVAQWPGGHAPIDTGLDASWIYGMNVLFNAGPVFGREVSFTYGPLGFLLNPCAVEGNLARALFFWIAVHLAIVALLVTAVRQKRNWQACGMVGLATLAHALGVWQEYWAALTVGIFVLAALLLTGKRTWAWALAAGGLAGVLAAIKLTSGAAAISILILALAFISAPIERKKRVAILAAAALVCVWVPIFFSFFDGVGSFVRWIEWSAEISSGYTAAMSTLGLVETLWNALAVALAYATFIALGADRQRRLAAAFAFILFVAFRHGYVRQDSHSTGYYTTAFAIPALLFFFAENRRERLAVLGLAAACLVVMVHHCNRPNSGMALNWSATWDHISLQKGLRRVGETLRLNEETERLEKLSGSVGWSGVPPGRWPEIMRADYGRVAALPWEITGLRAAGLSWQLLPSLQLYSAYTARLDIDTSAVFARTERPKWIWLMNTSIDGRTQFSDNPETWLAIIDHYEVVAADGRRNQMLLRSKASSEPTRTGPIIRRSTAKAGEWVDVEDRGRLMRVEIDLRPTLWGRLARLVYQWPAVSMEVLRERGDVWRFRMIPDTARNGLLLPLQPATVEEVAAAVANRPINRVKRFRILPPEGNYFNESIPLSWRETSRVFNPPQP